MSFVASRNHDFSGSTADLENKKDLIQYSWWFFFGKLQGLLEFGYIVCTPPALSTSAGQIMTF